MNTFKLFFILSSLLIFASSFVNPIRIYAEEITAQNYTDEIHVQRYIRNIMITGYCALATAPNLGPNTKCYGDRIQGTSSSGRGSFDSLASTPVTYDGFSQNGAIGSTTLLIAGVMSTPPTSSVEYLAHLGENIGITPQTAHAQVAGSGESIIHPVLNLWQFTRNVAYLFFILIFLIVGFMIMFRQRINPQTVVTAQQALPGLVIGLIIVTFSYFIASLLVDLSFWGTRLVAEIFIQSNLRNFYDINAAWRDQNIFNLYGGAGVNALSEIPGIFGSVSQSLRGTLPNGVVAVIGAIGLAVLAGVVGLSAPWALGAAAVGGTLGLIGLPAVSPQDAIAGISALLIPLILLIALFIQFIRLLIALIGAYIQILVYTVTGPFIILFASIPGRGGILGLWIRAIAGNALVFPAVFAAFLFAGVILGMTSEDWGQATLPLLAGIDVSLLRVLLAYGVLLGTPAVADLVRNALGVKGPQEFVQMAAVGFAAGAQPVLGGFGGGIGEMYARSPRNIEYEARRRAQIAQRQAEMLSQQTQRNVRATPIGE